MHVLLHHLPASRNVLPSAVAWVFILTLLLPRLAAVGVAIYLVALRRSQLQPTVFAKVFLAVATLLSIMEDIPNSVTTAAPPSHPRRYNYYKALASLQYCNSHNIG